jgi:hypothetical protein
MTEILVALAVLLHVAIAIVLLRKYIRTRDIAFIWLGGAVVIWPLISGLLELSGRYFIDRLARHESVEFYPFSLVSHGQITLGELVSYMGWFGQFAQLIGVCLLLVAVVYLAKTKSNNALHSAS